MKDINVEILMGLPGSGKTTLSKNLKEKIKNSQIISIDAIRDTTIIKKDKTIFDYLNIGLELINSRTETIIIDGLFLTNEQLFKGLSIVAEFYRNVSVNIHYFNEDRETCIKNDGGRRDTPSTNTILLADYEYPNIDDLNKKLKYFDVKILKIIKHNIVLKEDWYRYMIPKTKCFKDGILRSEKWCIGGTYGNCWDNHVSPLTPEEPKEFEALDNLLTEISPQITFLQYKKLMKECVTIEESCESDYYGGRASYNNYACNLNKLYNELREMKLI